MTRGVARQSVAISAGIPIEEEFALPRVAFRTLAATFMLCAAGVSAPSLSGAHADLIDLDACNLSPLSQPFAPWGDYSEYEPAPGGAFEQADDSGWTLTGGAHVVAGGDPYDSTGTPSLFSLALPAGAQASSPLACVDAAYPSARFFIGGSGLVAVSVIDGGTPILAGVAVGTGQWLPSPGMLTSAAVFSAFADGSAQVSLQFTALAGDVRIDDVWIDPWCRGG
jgi:hypothetical protein